MKIYPMFVENSNPFRLHSVRDLRELSQLQRGGRLLHNLLKLMSYMTDTALPLLILILGILTPEKH